VLAAPARMAQGWDLGAVAPRTARSAWLCPRHQRGADLGGQRQCAGKKGDEETVSNLMDRGKPGSKRHDLVDAKPGRSGATYPSATAPGRTCTSGLPAGATTAGSTACRSARTSGWTQRAASARNCGARTAPTCAPAARLRAAVKGGAHEPAAPVLGLGRPLDQDPPGDQQPRHTAQDGAEPGARPVAGPSGWPGTRGTAMARSAITCADAASVPSLRNAPVPVWAGRSCPSIPTTPARGAMAWNAPSDGSRAAAPLLPGTTSSPSASWPCSSWPSSDNPCGSSGHQTGPGSFRQQTIDFQALALLCTMSALMFPS